MPRNTSISLPLAALLLAAALPLPAISQNSDDEVHRIVGLGIEELMDVEVTIPARVAEKQFETSSATFVLTSEDIRRSGLTSIPEILRMVPGLHVARIDANKWSISMRGFPGRFAANLLVLIDQRTVYTPLFSGVYWDVQDVPLGDIERIEVIRGPGAALWGANAVNGVINIVTRNAHNTQGVHLKSWVGDEDTRFHGEARYGFRLGDDAAARIFFRYRNNDAATALDSDMSSNNGFIVPGQPAEDGWWMALGGARLDWNTPDGGSLTASGSSYDGHFGQTRIVDLAGTIADRDTIDADGANATLSYRHPFSATNEVVITAYFDWAHRTDASLEEERRIYDADLQHSFRYRVHELTWGLGYRRSPDGTRRKASVFFDPSSEIQEIKTAFVQDRVDVTHRLTVTLGAKVEDNSFAADPEFQPSVRTFWRWNEEWVSWLAVSRAVRMPSRAERDFVVDAGGGYLIQVGNKEMAPSELIAYEAGARTLAIANTVVDVAGFANHYDKLILEGANRGMARTYGVEVVARTDLRPWWAVTATWSYLHLDTRNNPAAMQFILHAPFNMATLQSHMNLPADLRGDVAVYYTDKSLRYFDRYTRVDVRVGWLPNDAICVFVVGQNLLKDVHAEATEAQRLSTGVERSFIAGASFNM